MEKEVLDNLNIKEFVYTLLKGNHFTELVRNIDYKEPIFESVERFVDFNKLDILNYLEAKTQHFDSKRIVLLKAEMEKARNDAKFELSNERYEHLDEDGSDYYAFAMAQLNAKDTEAPINKPAQKDVKRRGRPSKPFSSLMINDIDGSKLERIRALIKGRSGKSLAILILACIKKGWINKPSHRQIENEFGYVGNQSGYNKYVNLGPNGDYLISDTEIDGMMNALE